MAETDWLKRFEYTMYLYIFWYFLFTFLHISIYKSTILAARFKKSKKLNITTMTTLCRGPIICFLTSTTIINKHH